MGNPLNNAPATNADPWAVVSTEPLPANAAPATGADGGWNVVSEMPADKFQAAETAKPGFLRGLYEMSLGPLIDITGELASYYTKKKQLDGVLSLAGGPAGILADAAIDPNHPLNKLARGLVSAHVEQAKKTLGAAREAISSEISSIGAVGGKDFERASEQAREAALAGSEAVGHGLATVLPAVGPAAAKVGEDITQNPSYGAGEAVGLIGSMLGPRAISKAGDVLERARAAKAATAPVKAAQKLALATSPTGALASKDFMRAAQNALPEMRNAVKGGSSPLNLAGLRQATEIAGKALEDKFQSVLGPVKETKVSTDRIATAMEAKNTRFLQLKHPEIADEITKDADFYRAKEMTVADLDELRRGLNDELNSFYAKNAIKRADALSDPTLAHRVAEADALRDLEYQAVSEASGVDVRALKKLQSDLHDIRDAATGNLNKLIIRDARVRAQTLTQKFWDAAGETISFRSHGLIKALARVLHAGSPEFQAANAAAMAALKETGVLPVSVLEYIAPVLKPAGPAAAILAGAEEGEEK